MIDREHIEDIGKQNLSPTIKQNRVSREKLTMRYVMALRSVRFVVITHIYTKLFSPDF